MKKRTFIPTAIFAFLLLSSLSLPAIFADIDGQETGYWNDAEGNNYYGAPPSQSSSSSSSSSGPDYRQMWADKWAAQAEAKAQRQENARKQKAYDLNQKGIEFSSKGNFAKALEYYQKAAAVAPEDPVIQDNVRSVQGNMWTDKGIEYYNKSDFVNAKKMFELALTFRPGDPIITENLNATQSYLDQAEQENQKKQAAEQQINQVRDNVSNFSSELQERAANKNTSNLDFKGAPAAPASDEDQAGKLNKFKNMKPIKPNLIKRGPLPAGGSSTASGQGVGLVKSGKSAVAGSKIGDGEQGAQDAMIGFDTAGAASSGLEPVKLKGISLEAQDPDIPEARAGEFKGLVEQREKVRGQRKDLESKLEKLVDGGKENTSEAIKMKEKITEFKNKEVFVNFSIKEKLAVAPNVKKGK